MVCGCPFWSVTMWGISTGVVKDLSDSNNMFICMYLQSPLYCFTYGIHYFVVNHLNSPWQYLTGLYELAAIFKFLHRSGMYSNTILAVKLVSHIQRTWITFKNYSKLFLLSLCLSSPEALCLTSLKRLKNTLSSGERSFKNALFWDFSYWTGFVIDVNQLLQS